MLKIGVIVGSTRPGRLGKSVSDWFISEAKKVPTLSFDLIDLQDINLPILDESAPASMEKYQHDHTKKWSELIKQYDGYIFITPEYNHGYPASLKNAIDYLYNEWRRKPVAFVSYGGPAGGSRSVEQLRLVVNELHMMAIRPQVIVPNVWAVLEADGSYTGKGSFGDIPGIIEDLRWWAETLKNSREQ